MTDLWGPNKEVLTVRKEVYSHSFIDFFVKKKQNKPFLTGTEKKNLAHAHYKMSHDSHATQDSFQIVILFCMQENEG